MERLLVVSPLDVAGSPNSRTHHLVRHLAPHFRETCAVSRTNVTRRSRWERWSALVRVRSEVREDGAIRWVALIPWGSIRHGLGLHLLRLPDPYAVPRWGPQRLLRRLLSSMGLIFELGLLPSLALVYITRIRGRLDVVIGEGPWEMAFALLLRALGRAKTVVYDDIDYQPGFHPVSPFRRQITAALERFAIRRADVVVCVGDRLADLRRDQGAREVHVVPNGVDGSRFRLAQRHAGPKRSLRPTLIYTGYLGGWAGVDLVLDAARLASQRLPGLRVILLGHGSPLDLQALRDGIRAQTLEGVVEYRGEVSYEHLPAHLAEAHVGLVMFRPLDLTRYALPLKLVEYMAAGLPVLATADTEAADLVRRADAGAVIPFDAVATAEAALDLLQDAERYQGYADNAVSYSREYDWDRIMAKYYSLLKEQDASGIGRETAG